jgi:hypothetical protein
LAATGKNSPVSGAAAPASETEAGKFCFASEQIVFFAVFFMAASC